MLDYSEKRDFMRMAMDCPARYRVGGGAEVRRALIRNLSGNGVLMLTEQPVEADDELALEIMPGKTITPPLSAYVKVIRCDPSADDNFVVACTISRILSDEEVGPEFP